MSLVASRTSTPCDAWPGSFLAAANVSPKVARSVLRHSRVALTPNTYSRGYRDDQAEAVSRLTTPAAIKRKYQKAFRGRGGRKNDRRWVRHRP